MLLHMLSFTVNSEGVSHEKDPHASTADGGLEFTLSGSAPGRTPGEDGFMPIGLLDQWGILQTGLWSKVCRSKGRKLSIGVLHQWSLLPRGKRRCGPRPSESR